MKANGRINVKSITMTGLCIAILCVLSVISIPIGEVPYSLALLGVFLIGGLLRPANAGLACLSYLLLGVIGVPVFSRMTGGVGVLFGPTGGYLMAYPFMAMLIAFVRKRFCKKSVWFLTVGMILALLLGYAMGTGWFMLVTGWTLWASLAACVLPFFWFDAIKIAVAVIVLLYLRKGEGRKWQLD